jgi:hypothetical protein
MDTTVDPILAIAILVNIVKPGLASRWRPESPASDSIIRILALVLGIAGELIAGALTHTLSEASLNAALGRGFGHGVFAILLYHLVASRGPENALASSTPPTDPPALPPAIITNAPPQGA